MSELCEMTSALKGAGRQIRLQWPEDITTREIDYLVEAVNLQMQTYRRIAHLREAGIKNVADQEWNSWFNADHPARVAIPDNSEGLRP